jgi:hypothetical protein
MRRKHWSEYLEIAGACSDEVEWTRKYKTPQDAWKAIRFKRRPAREVLRGKRSEAEWAAVGRIEWAVRKMLGIVRWEAELGLGDYSLYNVSAADVRAVLPVPNLEDVKAIARGEVPWELV